MKTAMKRFFSLLLAMTMVLSMVPTAALAAEIEETEPTLVTEPAGTTAPPETTEAPATEMETEATTEATEAEVIETEAPETDPVETEAIETDPVETEAPVVEVEQFIANAPMAYVVADCIERDIQLPRVDMNLDQLPDDEDRFFEVYDFGGIECIRNYIGKIDPNSSYIYEVPGDYQGFDGQWLAAVLEFEGVAENGVLTIFDENTTVVINGTQCAAELLDEGTRIRATYVYQLQTIEVYNLYLNITAPVAGEDAVFEAQYASPTDERYAIGTAEGQLSYNNVRWIDANSRTDLKPGDKFKSGHWYEALIYVKAGTGCKFSDNITATVNGMDGIYVSRYYNVDTGESYDPEQYRVVVMEFAMEGEYDIYVENGYAYGADGDIITSAKPGDIVTLKPGNPPQEDIEGIENWSFAGWEVVTPDNSIFQDQENGDRYAETTIVMPEENVWVQCVFGLTNVEEVNFTLEGYGIGNFVDCLSVSEDAPGVEPEYNWDYYANYAVYDGVKGTPNSMLPAGTVIEAGETYWLVVKLNPVPGYSLELLAWEHPENIKLDGTPAKEVYLNDDCSLDVAFLLPAPATLPTGRITVENGEVYLNVGSEAVEEAPAGARVWLNAVVPDELIETHWFSHWEILEGDVEFDIHEFNGYFTMPEGNVSLKAVCLPRMNEVYLTITEPVGGKQSDCKPVALTDGVIVGDVRWYDCGGTHEVPLADGEAFGYESSYCVEIELSTDEGYVFPENPYAYLNDEWASFSRTNEGIWILEYVFYTSAKPYSITVEGGEASRFDGAVVTEAFVQEHLLVNAKAPEGYLFDHWEVVKGNVTLEWPENEEFEFFMPPEDVEFKAVFTDLKDLPIMIVDGNGGDLNPSYDISQNDQIDMVVRKGYDLYPEDITWTTSSAAIATVEQEEGKNYWNLVFHKPGTVTITAKDAYGCEDSIKITAYYVDTAKKFTVTSDVPSIGLQVGDRARMEIFGTDKENELSPIVFEYSVSKEGIVEVHEGWISGIAPGTVTITAKLMNDPAGRKVTLKVKVIEPQIDDISISYTCVNAVEEDIINLDDTNYTILYLNAEDFASAPGSITLTPKVKNTLGSEIKLTKALLKWKSSNTKVAKLKVNTDGTTTVTIPKKASGVARITLTANDKAKTEQIFVLHVRDYAPKLAATKFTLDWWKQPEYSYVPLNLSESYGNTITEVTVTEYSRVTKQYDVSSPNFRIRLEEDGSFSIGLPSNPAKSKGTVKACLNVTCANGKTYTYLISVTIQNKQPKIILSQDEKIDTAFANSKVYLTLVQATGVEAPVIASARAYDPEEGGTCFDVHKVTANTIAVEFSGFFKSGDMKLDPNLFMELHLRGYKTFQIKYKVATKHTNIRLTTEPYSLTITPVNIRKSIDFKILNADTGENLSYYVEHSSVNIPKSDCIKLDYNIDEDGGYLTAALTENAPTDKTVTYDISIPVLDHSNEGAWIKRKWINVKVKYIPKMPTISLDKKALTLNTTFTEREDQAIVTLSDTGLNRKDLDFEMICVDNGGTNAFLTGQMLSVVCEDGVITAKFKNPDNIPAAGKCTFAAIPVIEGMRLPKITVTVNVKADTSKVTITGGTAKLNKYLAGREVASVNCFASNGLQLLGFKENGNEFVDISYSGGQIHAKLKSSDAAAKYTFELTPKVKDPATGQTVYLAKKVKLTVQTYTNKKIGIQMSYTGKLDTLNPESVVTAFVSKVNNAAAGHQNLKYMTGADAKLFTYTEDQNGMITLRLKDGYRYATKKTYDVKFVYDLFGEEVTTNSLKIKVTQTAYKPVATPEKSTISLSSGSAPTMKFTVSLSGAAGARLDEYSIRLNYGDTALSVLKAMGVEPLIHVSPDGKTATVSVYFMHSSYLDSGRNYTLVLDVMPVGNASDVEAKSVTAKIITK